jgi:hypothetical protein
MHDPYGHASGAKEGKGTPRRLADLTAALLSCSFPGLRGVGVGRVGRSNRRRAEATGKAAGGPVAADAQGECRKALAELEAERMEAVWTVVVNDWLDCVSCEAGASERCSDQ